VKSSENLALVWAAAGHAASAAKTLAAARAARACSLMLMENPL